MEFIEIDDNLYQLENGSYLFIQSLYDDEDCNYGYYYFGPDKKLIDGGVFDLDAESEEDVIEVVLELCDLPADLTYELVEECADLEDLGFKGF